MSPFFFYLLHKVHTVKRFLNPSLTKTDRSSTLFFLLLAGPYCTQLLGDLGYVHLQEYKEDDERRNIQENTMNGVPNSYYQLFFLHTLK